MSRFRAFLAASPWVVQTAILIGIYVAVMAIATLWMPWHAWDMNLFASMSASQTATLDPRIVVVDVQSYSETENTSPQRSTVAAFLSKLASKPPAQHPTAVILDFNFGPCDLCARATAVLESSLLAARAANINVYAVEALPVDQNDVPGSLETHDPDIYEGYRYLAGFGHTTFVVADSGVLISRDCYAAVSYRAPNSDTAVTQPLESIITLVSTGFDGSNARQATLPCNTQQGAVYVGPSLTRSPYSTLPRDQFYPVTLAHSFPDVASLKGDYVIVGSVEHDQPIYESNIPDTQAAWQRLHGDGSVDIGGPELVAWALSDDLDASAMRGTQAVNGMLLFLVAAFSGVTALAFAACFLLLRRLQLRSARRFLPWIAAALACCIGLVVFAAFEALMLGLGKVQPQVSLISFAVLLSAGLSGCAVIRSQGQRNRSSRRRKTSPRITTCLSATLMTKVRGSRKTSASHSGRRGCRTVGSSRFSSIRRRSRWAKHSKTSSPSGSTEAASSCPCTRTSTSSDHTASSSCGALTASG